MPNQIFISYSKKDHDFAWKLADDLAETGRTVWIDRSLVVGEDWEQTIEQNLADAEEVIVVLSAHAVASKWVQHEGSIAYGLKKKMYPVLIEEIPVEDLPIWMSKVQYHRFIEVDYQTSLATLIAALTPTNPIRDLLDRKKIEFDTYQALMQARELELVAAGLENNGLELDDADKRLLLLSGIAHDMDQPWTAQAGEKGTIWLREALFDQNFPAAVRGGAIIRLGAANDGRTYDRLRQAASQVENVSSKNEALDLLALFLHHSPQKFEVPGQLQREINFRLARLRIRDGASERWRMIRAAVALALICAVIQSAWVIAASEDGLTAYDFIFLLIFGTMGAGSAYIFAETMTSLRLILYRQRFIWQVLTLFITGNLIGFFVFLFITGNTHLWVLGGLIGVMLAILNSRHLPNPALIRWGVGSVAGILAAITAYLLLQSTVPEAGEVISASLFSAGYIFFAVKT